MAATVEMLDLTEFAERMNVCANTVRNWIADCKLLEGTHYLHIGRIYRFPWSQDALEKLMRSLTPVTAPARPSLRSRQENRRKLKLRA